jgi:uncharacterized protein YbjT (DUF2867 family)
MTTTRGLDVAVFGASGGVGRHVLDQLLAAGHQVGAYVRNPAELERSETYSERCTAPRRSASGCFGLAGDV